MGQEKFASSRRGFLQALGGIGLGMGVMTSERPCISAASESEAGIRPSAEIFVGDHRQLLFDDFFLSRGSVKFADWPNDIKWTVGPVEKSPSPLLQADQPWEDQIFWVCAMYDGGRYRLWYNANDTSRTAASGLMVCYAESDDGVHWHKPGINVIDWNGSKKNNIVYAGAPDGWSVEMGNVFIDPAAKPGERYKMIFSAWESQHIYPFDHYPFVATGGVLRGAFSSDGLHWTEYPGVFLGRYPDTQNAATYDPILGKYVAYIRTTNSYGGLDVGEHPVKPASRGRSIARMESDDYRNWSYPELALAPDIVDGLDVDLYNPAYSRYENADLAHFLFPSLLAQHEGTLDVQVAVSRDNRTWVRPTRETFIPTGQSGSYDSTRVYAGSGFVPVGRDHHALYCRCENKPHGGARAVPGVKITPENAPKLGRAMFKRDRIVGIEAGAEGGIFTTRPLIFEGRHLVVNIEPTGPQPRLEIEMRSVGTVTTQDAAHGRYMEDAPCPGYTFRENIPLSADELEAPVRWTSRPEVGEWAGKPVRLSFRMRSMRIYAFQFTAQTQ